MEDEEIESDPAIKLREDIVEAKLTLVDFDHDDFDVCKIQVSAFVMVYRSYLAWVKSLSAKEQSSAESGKHYWFKHFRKLVKQSAIALLMEKMNVKIDNIPDETDTEARRGLGNFKFRAYETTLTSFYNKCIAAWFGIFAFCGFSLCVVLNLELISKGGAQFNS